MLDRFGNRLRHLRKAKGLSQGAFADASGLNRTYISGNERGLRNVALVNIAVIAETLGMTISQLTEGL